MINFPKHANFKVAATPIGGVVVSTFSGKLCLWSCSEKLGRPENSAAYTEAFTRAAAKLGWERDPRFSGGWKKSA